MNLLRHRPVTRDLQLPNGARYKVVVSDSETIQEVHAPDDRVHGTTIPDPIVMAMRQQHTRSGRRAARLRADHRASEGRKIYAQRPYGLWAPLPQKETAS